MSAAAQRQPTERAHVGVRIAGKRIARVKRMRTAERLFDLFGGQVDGEPTCLWHFRDQDTLPRFLDCQFTIAYDDLENVRMQYRRLALMLFQ